MSVPDMGICPGCGEYKFLVYSAPLDDFLCSACRFEEELYQSVAEQDIEEGLI